MKISRRHCLVCLLGLIGFLSLLFHGCRAQSRDEFRAHIDWRKVDYEVKQKSDRGQNEEFDDLVKWVVGEVNRRVEAGDLIITSERSGELGPLKEDIIMKYREEKGEEFDDLVIWVVDEVDRQIKSGKCIVNPNEPNLSDVMFLEKPTIKRDR